MAEVHVGGDVVEGGRMIRIGPLPAGSRVLLSRC